MTRVSVEHALTRVTYVAQLSHVALFGRVQRALWGATALFFLRFLELSDAFRSARVILCALDLYRLGCHLTRVNRSAAPLASTYGLEWCIRALSRVQQLRRVELLVEQGQGARVVAVVVARIELSTALQQFEHHVVVAALSCEVQRRSATGEIDGDVIADVVDCIAGLEGSVSTAAVAMAYSAVQIGAVLEQRGDAFDVALVGGKVQRRQSVL